MPAGEWRFIPSPAESESSPLPNFRDRDTIQPMSSRCIVVAAVLWFCCAISCALSGAQSSSNTPNTNAKQTSAEKKTAQKQATAKPLSPAEELQKAISDAGNDRAALVKNLQAYLEKYPEAPERPQIYRALVEACMQFHDDACATNYAERIVSLTPDDDSIAGTSGRCGVCWEGGDVRYSRLRVGEKFPDRGKIAARVGGGVGEPEETG